MHSRETGILRYRNGEEQVEIEKIDLHGGDALGQLDSDLFQRSSPGRLGLRECRTLAGICFCFACHSMKT